MTKSLEHKTHIVIHHSLTKDSETVSWGAIRNYHTNVQKWRTIGYHFGIELVGNYPEILFGRFLHETAAAVKEQQMNTKGIHICVVGNFDLINPPNKIWEVTVNLASFLAELVDIPTQNIQSHNFYASYKSCPGLKFDMIKFRREVEVKRKEI